MKIPLLNDFAIMLSIYTKLVSSPPVRQNTLEELKNFFDGRMVRHKDYFEGKVAITNTRRRASRY